MLTKSFVNTLIRSLGNMITKSLVNSLAAALRNIITAQKLKFAIEDFFSKCNQIRRKLKKSLMEKFIFYAVNVKTISEHKDVKELSFLIFLVNTMRPLMKPLVKLLAEPLLNLFTKSLMKLLAKSLEAMLVKSLMKILDKSLVNVLPKVTC